MVDDWLLDPHTGAFVDTFTDPMTRSHGGQIGKLAGVNGRYDFKLPAKQNKRLRLRLINAAIAQIFGLKLQGMSGWTVDLDGMPLGTPDPIADTFMLAPAQRMDLIVDVTAEEGAAAGLLFAAADDTWLMLAEILVEERAASVRRNSPEALPPNPRMEIMDAPDEQRPVLRYAGRHRHGSAMDQQIRAARDGVRLLPILYRGLPKAHQSTDADP